MEPVAGVIRPYEVFLERYFAWAQIPWNEKTWYLERAEAWHLYCDARDNLPDGTSKNRHISNLEKEQKLRQQEFKFHEAFNRTPPRYLRTLVAKEDE